MTEPGMLAKVSKGEGFVAALDQSGGSTPGALRQYGIPDDSYHGDAEMLALIHEMRVRIMSANAFSGQKLIGAILFEATMDGEAHGLPVPDYLWRERNVVPFLKVDKGLAAEADGVSVMKPIPGLDELLDRGLRKGIFGTKMRSVIHKASPTGVSAIVDQQFELAARICEHGLVPIVEPEVSIKAPDKAAAEALLRDAIVAKLDALPADHRVMLKLTIPEVPDLYSPLIEHPRVVRVVALSGGYSRAEACRRLVANHGMVASFSRALIDDLRKFMDDATFEAALAEAIDEIYEASVHKS